MPSSPDRPRSSAFRLVAWRRISMLGSTRARDLELGQLIPRASRRADRCRSPSSPRRRAGPRARRGRRRLTVPSLSRLTLGNPSAAPRRGEGVVGGEGGGPRRAPRSAANAAVSVSMRFPCSIERTPNSRHRRIRFRSIDVGHHVGAPRMRLPHDCADLLLRVLQIPDRIAR